MVPNSHLNGQGYGKTSSGEKIIKHYLLQKGIYFEKEKTFSDLRSDKNKPLKFDIYIPSLNLCVEFQGEQHYKPVERFGGIEGPQKITEK